MKYVCYFLYLGWYWDFDFAWFIIRHEIAGERRYGINTTGTDRLSDVKEKDSRQHATMYEPVNYYSAGWLFDRLLPQDKAAAFLDVGCGKGRTLAMAAAYGFRDIYGIDLSPKLCSAAERIKRSLLSQYGDVHVLIQCMDARYYDVPETVGVIFLFNPFDAVVMQALITKVEESLHRKNRPMKILYANPEQKLLWLEAGFHETASFKEQHYLKGCILERWPPVPRV